RADHPAGWGPASRSADSPEIPVGSLRRLGSGRGVRFSPISTTSPSVGRFHTLLAGLNVALAMTMRPLVIATLDPSRSLSRTRGLRLVRAQPLVVGLKIRDGLRRWLSTVADRRSRLDLGWPGLLWLLAIARHLDLLAGRPPQAAVDVPAPPRSKPS